MDKIGATKLIREDSSEFILSVAMELRIFLLDMTICSFTMVFCFPCQTMRVFFFFFFALFELLLQYCS